MKFMLTFKLTHKTNILTNRFSHTEKSNGMDPQLLRAGKELLKQL